MAPSIVFVLGLTALIPLLALSAFFSSSETAIFSLSSDTRDLDSDDPRSLTLERLRSDPHRLLVTLLVGNNLINIAISSIITVLVTAFVPPVLAVVLTTAIASTLVLIFGEIVPKSYGLGRAKTWALRVAGPLTVVEIILGPIVFLFEGVTRRLSSALGGEMGIEDPYLQDR